MTAGTKAVATTEHFNSFSFWGETAAPSPEPPSGAMKSALKDLKVPATKCCYNQARMQLPGSKMLEEMCKLRLAVIGRAHILLIDSYMSSFVIAGHSVAGRD